MIYCPYSGLDDPTNRTLFIAVDMNGNMVPGDQLEPPKYTFQQLESTLVLTVSDYSPQDLYHTFICNTSNQAGRDSQRITLEGKNFLVEQLDSCSKNGHTSIAQPGYCILQCIHVYVHLYRMCGPCIQIILYCLVKFYSACILYNRYAINQCI